MGSLQQTLALLFKRKGKAVLSEKEFVFSASIDFRWFTPKEAQQLLDLGLRSKLLERTNGYVRPTFDYKRIDVPPDLHPGKDVLTPPESGDDQPLFPRLLEKISRDSGLKKREVVARINRIQERLGVDIEVAALVAARDIGLEIEGMIAEVKKEIGSR